MEESLVQPLQARRAEIRSRWNDLLHVERALSPLAHPDTLVYLLDETLEKIFSGLSSAGKKMHPAPLAPAPAWPHCDCGRNPFLRFYVAGEHAILEALVIIQAEIHMRDANARDRAVLELYAVVRRLARHDVELFCSLCQLRDDRRAAQALSGAG
jgi:hypothetical protein